MAEIRLNTGFPPAETTMADGKKFGQFQECYTTSAAKQLRCSPATMLPASHLDGLG
jgi:hypothetical protein